MHHKQEGVDNKIRYLGAGEAAIVGFVNSTATHDKLSIQHHKGAEEGGQRYVRNCRLALRRSASATQQ